MDPSSAAIGETPPYRPHLGDSRQYWRDIILGVNDGLVSIFLLVAGVVGGGLSSSDVLLTAIAGAVAGAISMAAGEYLATKSQDEVFSREMALEEEHFTYHRQREVDELEELLADLGLHGEVLKAATAQLAENDESMLKVMMALEFGALEKERRSPWKAMIASGALFLVGALPSVVPFFFVTEHAHRAHLGSDLRRDRAVRGGVREVGGDPQPSVALRLGEFCGGRRRCRGQLSHRESVRSGGVSRRRRTADGSQRPVIAIKSGIRSRRSSGESMELYQLGIEELAAGYRTREFGPVEVVEALLARIEAVGDEIDAFATVTAETALGQAIEAERALRDKGTNDRSSGFP